MGQGSEEYHLKRQMSDFYNVKFNICIFRGVILCLKYVSHEFVLQRCFFSLHDLIKYRCHIYLTVIMFDLVNWHWWSSQFEALEFIFNFLDFSLQKVNLCSHLTMLLHHVLGWTVVIVILAAWNFWVSQIDIIQHFSCPFWALLGYRGAANKQWETLYAYFLSCNYIV